ncbi:MAG: glycosyltransferase family 4 protein [Promethearchaeota archaeon]
MIKILYFPTRYFPAISGAEFYMQRMAEIFNSKKSYSIKIYTSNALDFMALRESNGKVVQQSNKYYFNVNKLEINRFPITHDLTLEEKLAIFNECSVLKTLNLKQKTLNDGKAQEIPVICTPFFHFANPRYLNKDLTSILKNFDHLIACTNAEKKFLVKKKIISEEKISVIPMGVDYETFDPKLLKKKKIKSFKKTFFNNGETSYKMVLFCGYKNFEKGAISLLKAIPFIINKYKKVYFVFIGPSTEAFNREFRNLEKKYRSRIINLTPSNLKGYYDEKKIAAFIESDVYVMPSRSDAYGISFLEAWAARTPVIGARIGATPEVIKENVDGLLVNFNDEQDIAQKILILLRKKRLNKKLASNGYKKVRNELSWQEITNKTEKLYKNILRC